MSMLGPWGHRASGKLSMGVIRTCTTLQDMEDMMNGRTDVVELYDVNDHKKLNPCLAPQSFPIVHTGRGEQKEGLEPNVTELIIWSTS